MTDIRGARILRLMDDPLIGGDLLLVALGLAAQFDLDWDFGGHHEAMAKRLWPDARSLHWKITNVFKMDMPRADHRSALAPHFPELDWQAFWRLLDPRWVEHPEVSPWPKPSLQLVLGDGESRGLHGVPLLSVVPIGGAS